MLTLWRVNEQQIGSDGAVLLEVLSHEATETETSYRIAKGGLALSTQVLPKGKCEAWGIGRSRAEALALARQRAERQANTLNDGLAQTMRKIGAIRLLETGDDTDLLD
jgi:hypothetical protein